MNPKILANEQWLDGKVSGKSVKYNNFVNASSTTSETKNGVTFTISGNKIILNGTSTATISKSISTTQITNGHNIFIKGLKGSNSGTYWLRYFDNALAQIIHSVYEQGYVGIPTSSNDYGYIYIIILSGQTFNNFEIEPIITDLTANDMASISTLADFYLTDIGKLVQAGVYLPYSTGGILSATSPFEFVGRNITPNNFELGTIYLGNDYPSSNAIRTPNNARIKVTGGTSYYLKGTNENTSTNSFIFEYDSNGTWLDRLERSGSNINNGLTYYLNANCSYIRIVVAVGTTNVLFQPSTETATSYVPYAHATYNPSPALTLRAVGKDLTSLLGKQNVPFVISTNNSYCVFKRNDNDIVQLDYVSHATNSYKSSNLISGHTYITIVNVTGGGSFSQIYITNSSATNGYPMVNYGYYGNYAIAINRINTTADDVLHIRIQGLNTKHVRSISCIDLTAIGLDNLTAQQFYDNYNQYFEKLADGQTINTLCDTLWNCSGNVERKCGTRAYQSGDENNPSVITDGTTTIYPLATPTTEQHPSIAIPKLATKCTDANGMEIDIVRNN